MKSIFFILLFILSNFVCAQNLEEISSHQRNQFNMFKDQIFLSLQGHVIKKEGFKRFSNIVEDNKDFLLQDFNQKLLKELINSESFQNLILKAIWKKPVALYGLSAFIVFSILRTMYGIEIASDFLHIDSKLFMSVSHMVGILTFTFIGSVFVTEELADYFIVRKLPLPKKSRPGVFSRTMSTCKRVFSKPIF